MQTGPDRRQPVGIALRCRGPASSPEPKGATRRSPMMKKCPSHRNGSRRGGTPWGWRFGECDRVAAPGNVAGQPPGAARSKRREGLGKDRRAHTLLLWAKLGKFLLRRRVLSREAPKPSSPRPGRGIVSNGSARPVRGAATSWRLSESPSQLPGSHDLATVSCPQRPLRDL